MSIEHAQHNEKLCEKLHGEAGGEWNDWVVTTAFYSAVHYSEQRLFPLKIKDQEFQNFDEYYVQRKDGSKNQHDARLRLINLHLNKAHGAYRWLYDTCRNARYYDYKTTQPIADASIIKLRVVKSLCVPATKVTTVEA